MNKEAVLELQACCEPYNEKKCPFLIKGLSGIDIVYACSLDRDIRASLTSKLQKECPLLKTAFILRQKQCEHLHVLWGECRNCGKPVTSQIKENPHDNK